jgi:hypothetical protein
MKDNSRQQEIDYLTDDKLNDILRSMGVDVDKKKSPHWITQYYHSKSIFGGKYENGYICSQCGKHSWVKKDVCDGCNSVMTKLEMVGE